MTGERKGVLSLNAHPPKSIHTARFAGSRPRLAGEGDHLCGTKSPLPFRFSPSPLVHISLLDKQLHYAPNDGLRCDFSCCSGHQPPAFPLAALPGKSFLFLLFFLFFELLRAL